MNLENCYFTFIKLCNSPSIAQRVMSKIEIPCIKCLCTQFEQKSCMSIFKVFNEPSKLTSRLLNDLTLFGLLPILLIGDNVHLNFSMFCCHDISSRESSLTEAC